MGTLETIVAMNAARKAAQIKPADRGGFSSEEKAEPGGIEDEKKAIKQDYNSDLQADFGEKKKNKAISKQELISSKILDRYGNEYAPVPVSEMNEIQREADFEIENRQAINSIAGEALRKIFGDGPYPVKDFTKATKEAAKQLWERKKAEENKIKDVLAGLKRM